MKQKDLKWMNWKKKYPGRHLNPLDVSILKFLWKWKVHDSLVLAFQMGEWLWQSDKKPKSITDQELLRYPKAFLDEYLPKS